MIIHQLRVSEIITTKEMETEGRARHFSSLLCCNGATAGRAPSFLARKKGPHPKSKDDKVAVLCHKSWTKDIAQSRSPQSEEISE